MKRLAILSLAAILAASCQAQEDSSKNYALNEIQKDTTKPKGTWSVNKEVDEHGKIIRYDSIYSWSSSGNELRTLQHVNPDSLMTHMRERMRSAFGITGGDPFDGFFGSDSIQTDPFMSDFFSNDPFGAFPNMDAIRKRMEAMMQTPSKDGLPSYGQPWIPAEPEKARRTKEKTEKITWKQTI